MQYTTNLNLKKPERLTDPALVKDINDNMDIIDASVGLVSGQNRIGNIVLPCYNTGSGNYVDMFIPVRTNGLTISGVDAAGCVIFNQNGRYDFGEYPSITVADAENVSIIGVRIDLEYPTSKTPNICGTALLTNVSIYCV